MKAFEAARSTFGRHETFALRYGWITKGLLALKADSTIFEQDNAVISLGVGKNMVSAIRYWLLAAQLASFEKNAAQVEELAEALMFDPAWDPFLEDDATLWLVHWLIASNAKDATAWFWFFNKFHKTYFSAKELADELDRYVASDVGGKFSHVTLKADVSVLLRSYCSLLPSAAQSADDSLDCPFSNLGLMHVGADGRYQCVPSTRAYLPAAVVGFSVLQLMNARDQRSIPIAKLMHSEDGWAAPGAVFRLTEDALLGKLEELIVLYPDHFALRDTAGIHQLYLLEQKVVALTPNSILASHYDTMKVAQ
jgi:hypothetical protein